MLRNDLCLHAVCHKVAVKDSEEMESEMIYITIGGEEILSSVAEAEMIAKVNDHAALFVRGIVDNFYANKALDLLDKEIILYTMTGEKKEILFAGIISEVRLKVEGKLISADIRCTSYSVRFDSVKKQQAFQNTLLTYMKK